MKSRESGTGVRKKKPTIAEGEVLVKIKRVGICGTDLHAFKGNRGLFEYPRVLGHELSGVIEDAGNSDFDEGQAVLIIPSWPHTL